jgi:nucleotide-binding universal stress UspA family protein
MAVKKRQRILIATDGSPSARAAVATALRFPWHPSSVAAAVLARFAWLRTESEAAQAVLDDAMDAAAEQARREVAARWPRAKVTVVNASPSDAILDEAERFGATVIVLGWRGHGTFRRLLAGSVSRSVAAHAKCPVLIVREAPRAIRRVVIAYDGCPNAVRSVEFLASLEPARGAHARVVNVVEPATAPGSVARLPSATRAEIRHRLSEENEQRLREAQECVAAAVARLQRAGWQASSDIRVGAPVASLLTSTQEHRADLLVVGARATSGIERALLGSVANALLNRAAMPVLLVR